MKVLIGTTNPSKIEGARIALSKYFKEIELTGISVDSNVAGQPVDKDIYIGAKNRVANLITYAKENSLDIDYFLGIEAGLTNLLGSWQNINIAVIKDKYGYESFGTSAGFPVPEKYIEEIIEKELGSVFDSIFQKHNLSKGKGGINFLTKGEVSRVDLTEQAFTMALTPFINDDIWKDEDKKETKWKIN